MKSKAPRVVRKIKLGGTWIFAAVARKGDRLDFAHVVVKGKTIPAAQGSFHLDYTDEKGRRRRPCIGDDPAAVKRALSAQQHVLELRRRGIFADDAPELQRREEGKTLASVLADFIAHPPAGLGRTTVKKYKGTLRDFVDWAAAGRVTHVPMVQDATMHRWIAHMRDQQHLEPATIGDKVQLITGELKRLGCTFKLRPADLPKVTVKEREIYSPDMLRSLFAACSPVEYALYQTFLLTGMREQEVMFLFDTDIDARRSIVRVTAKPKLGFRPKNYHERSVSVPRRLVELLQKHLGERTGLVFGTSSIWAGAIGGMAGGKPDKNMLNKLKRLARRAGLNCGTCEGEMHGRKVTCATHAVCRQFGLHKFRHTYATMMLRDRMDIESLRKLLGHADLASTRRYLHARDVDDLQADVEVSSLAAIV